MTPKKDKARRYAKNCVLIEESKSNPGYKKYCITIVELDGSEVSVPAYGFDMQDAISRLLKNERAERLNKVYINKIEPGIIVAASVSWISSVVLSAITNNYKYAFIAVISMFSIFTLYAVYRFFKDIEK